MINIRQRRQQVSASFSQAGVRTIRSIAADTKIPKSSVHRHLTAIRQRDSLSASSLWTSPPGEQWLQRLVVAAIYVFVIKRGVGAESLCEFFHKLQLENHIGISVSSIRKIQGVLEGEILAYQKAEHERLSQACTPLPKMCVGVDETWFEQTVLVMMELSSGYLLVEEMTDTHRYITWQQSIQPVLKQWQGQIQYCVNDRAKALIKLALNDLGCPSIADLFHAMRKLTQGLGRELEQRLAKRQRRLREVKEQDSPSALELQTLQNEVDHLHSTQTEFRQHLIQITLGLHPFDAEAHSIQTTQQVALKLEQQVAKLKQFQQTRQLKDASGSIDKFNRQIDDLSALVDVWWAWVHQSLAAQTLSASLMAWLTTVLLPLCYWHSQVQRTDKPALNAYYQTAYQHAQAALLAHPTTSTLDGQTYRDWVDWAHEMVTKFQRTTAAVEGRNGYLTQIHHSRRGLSPHRLRVMTAIHNFDLQRADGSTAAKRLFKQTHPDLFQTVLAQMPDLPLSRRRAKSSVSPIIAMTGVPA